MEREVEERFERIEAITARHAEFMAQHDAMMARHDETMAELAARAAAHQLAIANLDDLLTKLAAAQIVTEQKLQGLIDALRRSGNGNN